MSRAARVSYIRASLDSPTRIPTPLVMRGKRGRIDDRRRRRDFRRLEPFVPEGGHEERGAAGSPVAPDECGAD